jgi:hypothetical protein
MIRREGQWLNTFLLNAIFFREEALFFPPAIIIALGTWNEGENRKSEVEILKTGNGPVA